jgi:predicted nuclease with TOPRIM domain
MIKLQPKGEDYTITYSETQEDLDKINTELDELRVTKELLSNEYNKVADRVETLCNMQMCVEHSLLVQENLNKKEPLINLNEFGLITGEMLNLISKNSEVFSSQSDNELLNKLFSGDIQFPNVHVLYLKTKLHMAQLEGKLIT